MSTSVHQGSEPIAALATPSGPGAIAVVRLSGDGVAERVTRLFVDSPSLVPHRALPVRLRFQAFDRDSPGTAVPALAILFLAGASYTGEESVELYLPGCEPILDGVLEQLRTLGVRAAEPGEFTKRAFLSGRIDLTRAEAVAQIIAADDLQAARAARRVLDGGLAREVTRIGDGIHDVIALLEAGLDFSEQEVEPPPAIEVRRTLDGLRRSIAALLEGEVRPVRSAARVRIALWGRANAGKSTLLNAIVGRDVAITSDRAGTTRDPVSATFRAPGWPEVEFVDLPGERDPADRTAVDETERHARQIGFTELDDAEWVLYLLDGTRPRADRQSEWDALPGSLRERAWLVTTKQDLGGSPIEVGATRSISVAATDSDSVAELVSALGESLRRGRWDDRSAAFAFTARQFGQLGDAQAKLAAIDAALAPEGSSPLAAPELLAIDLREAHSPLEEITGAISTEGTLDKIFSQFCLGK